MSPKEETGFSWTLKIGPEPNHPEPPRRNSANDAATDSIVSGRQCVSVSR